MLMILLRYGRLDSTEEAITHARVLLSVLHPRKNSCPETATKVVPALQRGLPVVSNVHVQRTIKSHAAGECQTPSHCAGSTSNSSCWFVCGEAHVDSAEAFATAVCALLVDDAVWTEASAAALQYSKLVRCLPQCVPCLLLACCMCEAWRCLTCRCRCRGRAHGTTCWIR